jgi:hypothetical protein
VRVTPTKRSDARSVFPTLGENQSQSEVTLPWRKGRLALAKFVFASIYALFSGIVFIGVLGMLLAPFVHRIMHKLHMEEDKKGK